MPTTLLAHEYAQLTDAIIFRTLPDISGIWDGLPVYRSESGGWVEGLAHIRRIDTDPAMEPAAAAGEVLYLAPSDVVPETRRPASAGQQAGAV
ncbi:hypothetical protein F9278_26390 [Streptomyces phaeolivaceus]|uniref:Uncharacterized protein n=1 Tax=Streptomyces phaeolivaceus TaxID=2653200 RepID=A0A5P8K7V8_9ACTN|nr:hypothetical protein [Streptomyces phaeolivaceus]QFQ99086.1 hypothetical protein F9278_26390 [Streptomyces phaeolivaceus]